MENRIRQLRKKRYMSQVSLARELEISQEAICAYETGKNYPSVKALIKMSDLFGCSVDYILGLSDGDRGEKAEREERKAGHGQESYIAYTLGLLTKRQQELVFAYIQGLLQTDNRKETVER